MTQPRTPMPLAAKAWLVVACAAIMPGALALGVAIGMQKQRLATAYAQQQASINRAAKSDRAPVGETVSLRASVMP